MGETTLFATGPAVKMKSGTRSSGRTEGAWNRFSAFARWRRAHSVSHWPTSFHDLGPKRMKYAGLGRDHGTAAGAGWWSAAMPLPWAAGRGRGAGRVGGSGAVAPAWRTAGYRCAPLDGMRFAPLLLTYPRRLTRRWRGCPSGPRGT